MGRHPGPVSGVVLASLVLGVVVLVPVGLDTGMGGVAAAHAGPVDPTLSRRPTSTGKPSPTPTSTPTDPTSTAEPSGTSTATATATDPTSTPTSDPGGGSTGGPGAQSVPDPFASPQPARATTPSSAASPTGGNGNATGSGNGTAKGKGSGNGQDNRAGPKPGRGAPNSTAVAVAGRRIAAPIGDEPSAQQVGAASGASDGGAPGATVTPAAPESSGPVESATGGSTTPTPDQADVSPGQDAIPDIWRLAAIAAAFAAGLAVALLLAIARPRGGAHRRL